MAVMASPPNRKANALLLWVQLGLSFSCFVSGVEYPMVRQSSSCVYFAMRSRSIRLICAGDGMFPAPSHADASGMLPSCLNTMDGLKPNTALM